MFAKESAISSDIITANPDPKTSGLMEKKWRSVVRLQRRVLELENQVESLQEEVKVEIRMFYNYSKLKSCSH